MRAAKQPSDANAAAAAVAAGGRRDPAGGLRASYTTDYATDYATDYTTDIPQAYHGHTTRYTRFSGVTQFPSVSTRFHICWWGGGEKIGENLGQKTWEGARQQAIGDQDREFPTVHVTRGLGVGQARPPEPDRPPRRAAPRSVLPRDAATLPGRELPAHGPNGCPAPSAVYPEIVGSSRP